SAECRVKNVTDASGREHDERGRFAGGQADPAGLTITPTTERAFTGKPVPLQHPLSKDETGKVGEAVATAWLKANGAPDARHLNLDRNNFPIDLVQDHESVEVKAGQVSNGPKAQQWRLTIGEPGKEEKAWLKTATPEEKAAWNERKQQ